MENQYMKKLMDYFDALPPEKRKVLAEQSSGNLDHLHAKELSVEQLIALDKELNRENIIYDFGIDHPEVQ